MKSPRLLSVTTIVAALCFSAAVTSLSNTSPAFGMASQPVDAKRTERTLCVHSDTEQPADKDKEIKNVKLVKIDGVHWYEAETEDGGRYKVDVIGTSNAGLGGKGNVQIGDKVYYIRFKPNDN